jgi:hypothetical protein
VLSSGSKITASKTVPRHQYRTRRALDPEGLAGVGRDPSPAQEIRQRIKVEQFGVARGNDCVDDFGRVPESERRDVA